MDAHDELRQLAEDRQGFVLQVDARTVGLTRAAVRYLVSCGEWERHGRRLLRRRGAPWTKASPLVRAVLDAGPGAVLSHTTAAAWWGLPGYDLRTIHVTRPRGLTSTPARFASVVHAVLDLTDDQVAVLDGVPIVRPERSLFELAASQHPERVGRAIDAAIRRGLCSVDSLRRVHEGLAERGRKGTTVLRALLEERSGEDWRPPESNLEARFERLMKESLLGPWRRQVELGGETWCGRVDFLHERLPLVVEVQSQRYHAALTDRVSDSARRARLEAAGFVVVEVWDDAIWHDPESVKATVRAAIRSFGAAAA